MIKLTDEQIESAAKKMAECFDFPWDYMPEQGRKSLRSHVQSVIAAADIRAVETEVLRLNGLSGWQPIETAPKDGATVLVGRCMGNFGFVRGYARWEGGDSFVSGWISHGFTEIPGNLGLAHPTHWMPLPPAPQQGGE